MHNFIFLYKYGITATTRANTIKQFFVKKILVKGLVRFEDCKSPHRVDLIKMLNPPQSPHGVDLSSPYLILSFLGILTYLTKIK
jgi:hypothetical protein